jgi:hypothetical protein
LQKARADNKRIEEAKLKLQKQEEQRALKESTNVMKQQQQKHNTPGGQKKPNFKTDGDEKGLMDALMDALNSGTAFGNLKTRTPQAQSM